MSKQFRDQVFPEGYLEQEMAFCVTEERKFHEAQRRVEKLRDELKYAKWELNSAQREVLNKRDQFKRLWEDLNR